MSLNAVKILEISITTNSKNEVLEYCRKYLSEISNLKSQISKKPRKTLIIVTPNPEQVVYAQKDKHFAKILNRADVALPDGGRLVWASRLIGKVKIQERIPGVEFMEDMVKLASERGYRIGLIGGRSGVAVEALECLMRKHPGLQGFTIGDFETGAHGEESEDTKTLRYLDTRSNKEDIQIRGELKARSVSSLISQYLSIHQAPLLLFIGLGAPKQEYFIEELRTQNLMTRRSVVFMAVGGSFDIIARRIPRAPLLIRLIGFEWVWRLGLEPWRWRRQLALVKFLWLVLREKRGRLKMTFKV